MENDLISRSALLEAFDNFPPGFKKSISGMVALRMIKGAPTVDAEPVRHGMWILLGRSFPTTDYTYTTSALYMCSECGLREIKKYPYCNCGAKMDAEVE